MNAAKALVRGSFGRAAHGYDEAAEFQREAGHRLLAGLPFDCDPALILDAGCGTGHGSALLRERWPAARIAALDFALGMMRQVAPRTVRICADAEALPLASRSLDFYWSNLTLQWCDLTRFISEAARVMKPGARLAVTTLGPGSFAELREAFAGVDAYRHTMDFRGEPEVAAALSAAGLTLRGLESRSMLRHYPDIASLLASVRDLGANRVTGPNRRAGLMGKLAWQRFIERYEMLRTSAGLPLTYDTQFIYAEK